MNMVSVLLNVTMDEKFSVKINAMQGRTCKKYRNKVGMKNTLGHYLTEHGGKERQGKPHCIGCITHFCNGCSVVFVFLSHHILQ